MNLAQICSSLLFITIITILTGEELYNCSNPDICLPYYVIPVHYHIKLHIEKYDFDLKTQYDDFNFFGESSTTISILQSTKNIKLHGLNLILINPTITMTTNNITCRISLEKSFTNHFTLSFCSVLYPGLYTLKMKFYSFFIENFPKEKPFFKSLYTTKENSIAWLIALHKAKGLFPCWDEPHLKATFTIFIKSHHSFTLLSNMPIQIHLPSDTYDFIWTQFYTTPPLSTFQIAVVMTNYPRIRINDNICLLCERCTKYYRHSLKVTKTLIENITLHLQSEFDEINIPKMDHVAIPNFPQDDISKWGLIFHREADLFYNEQLDPVMRKMEVARLIAPKIAHQWFGNVLSPSWWSHFWLYDGLATLFGEEVVVKTFKNSGIMDFFIVQSQYESLHLDSHFDMNPTKINNMSEIDSIFNFPRYMKVLIVLRMFQNAITNETFRKNVQTYVYKHTFSSMVSNELSFMQEILANSIYSNDISNEFLIWIKYKYYPVVNLVEEVCFKFNLSTQNFNTTSHDNWWIPIRLISNFFVHENIDHVVVLSHESSSFTIETIPEHWAMLDIQRAGGYYRVNYESENWHKIIHYLVSNSEKYKYISAMNRAKIIDDAFHLTMARKLNVSIFWELTKYLSNETNYVAWYPMIKVFEHMSTIFPFPSDTYSDSKEKFRKLLDKPLRTLGFEENIMDNDFIKCLRQEIVKWACTLDHSECAKEAHHNLRHYLRNLTKSVSRKKYPVLSEWKQWIYCKGLSIANNSMWVELNIILSRKLDHKLLPFLACCIIKCCINQGTVIEIAMLPRLFINQFTPNEKQDIAIIRSRINIFFSIVKYINSYYILNELLLNLPSIIPKEIKMLTALTVIINNIYSVDLLEFKKRYSLNEMENLRYINIEQLLMIRYKIRTRKLEIKNHIKHFQFINV